MNVTKTAVRVEWLASSSACPLTALGDHMSEANPALSAETLTNRPANIPHLLGKTALLATGNLFSRLLQFVVAIFIIRHLDPASYGDFTLAYAYQAVFITLASAGLDVILTRLGSQSPSQLGRLIGSGILLKVGLAAVAYLLSVGLLPLWGYRPGARNAILVFNLTLLVNPLAIGRLIFLIHQQIRKVVVLDVLAMLVWALLSLIGVLSGAGATGILGFQLAAGALTSLLYLYYGRRLLSGPLVWKIDLGIWRRLLLDAWPVAISGLLYILHTQIARLLIGNMLSEAEGGHFSLATNLGTLLTALPGIYFSAVYPLLARDFSTNRPEFERLVRLSFQILLAIALPFAILLSFTSSTVVRLYAGPAYLDAAPLASALAWLEVFSFLWSVIYYAMLAADLQRLFPKISIALILVRLVCLLVWLPRIGLFGAIAAGLVMNLTALAIYFLLIPTRPFLTAGFKSSLRPLLAGLGMAALLGWLQPSLLFTWIAGVAIYAGLTLFLGLLNRETRHLVYTLMLARHGAR
jgi:O-antigen/teichoic acid export membrane protein